MCSNSYNINDQYGKPYQDQCLYVVTAVTQYRVVTGAILYTSPLRLTR